MTKRTDTQNTPQTDAPAPEETCGESLNLIHRGLRAGVYEPLPKELAGNATLRDILNDLQRIQQSLVRLTQGDLDTPVQLTGYTGGMIKALQSNLRHITWKARQLAHNDFSQQIDFMGEISSSFNLMGTELKNALTQLETQKEDQIRMAEELRCEVDARIAVENDLRREEKRLRKFASEDPLTEIANRRSFFQLAQRELERMHRTKRPACLAMLDIDYFKEMNDNFGHGEGDNALRSLAKLATATIRPYDIAGRYGGDEFVILFPETTLETAYAVLERLRLAVEKMNQGTCGKSPNVTISAGISEIDVSLQGTRAINLALSRADKALYKSKLRGRNCVSTTSGEPD